MARHALNVQIYLKMHRSDHAEKQLKIVLQIDEDHILTQLANAWVNLAVGGSKIQEAYLIFQDFSGSERQLKLSHPDHLLVHRASSAEVIFERAVQAIA
ncbi:putative Coatomer subunit epsilon [Cocos nucifera]|uniref:Putative Coatomer subunit epsilon n=1 Tax=Cocos nucifera TaxID=13894 RepID=A0A8K0MXF1_COCNU|nr:putative Coatomer subunit epsilon [Cocos nucifera]